MIGWPHTIVSSVSRDYIVMSVKGKKSVEIYRYKKNGGVIIIHEPMISGEQKENE